MTNPSLRLTLKKGPKRGRKFPISHDRLIIGSDPNVEIVLPVESVDPRHASLTFEGQRLILADLGSRGGTFRNGQRLLAPLQVFPGDRIGIGPDVVLILDGHDPSAQPVDNDEAELDPGMAASPLE